jgi:hypothetical protein
MKTVLQVVRFFAMGFGPLTDDNNRSAVVRSAACKWERIINPCIVAVRTTDSTTTTIQY